VKDASGWSDEDLHSIAFEGVTSDLLVENLIHRLDEDAREATYWICMFAVNQHTGVCGDCPCRTRNIVTWSPEQFASPKCEICSNKKFLPCTCGSQKTSSKDPHFERGMFVDVLRYTEYMLVSLDPELMLMTRLWAAWELGEAFHGTPVRFAIAKGLHSHCMWRIEKGSSPWMAGPLTSAKVGYLDDKPLLLGRMEDLGGETMVQKGVHTIMKLYGGITDVLLWPPEGVEPWFTELLEMEIDFRWNPLAHQAHIIRPVEMKRLRSLRRLTVNFSGTGRRDMDDLGENLYHLIEAEALHLNFSRCSQLEKLEKVSKGIHQVSRLRVLEVNLAYSTRILDSDTLWHNIGSLKETLQKLTVNVSGFSFGRIKAEIAEPLSALHQLQELRLSFRDCRRMTESRHLVQLSCLSKLQLLALDFSGCLHLDLEASMFAEFKEVRKLYLNFAECRCVTGLFDGSLKLPKRLKLLDLDLSGLPDVMPDVESLGRELRGMAQLKELKLNLSYCESLRSAAGLWSALGDLKQLQQLLVNLSRCTSLEDVSGIGSLGSLEGLRGLELRFEGCGSLSKDVSPLKTALQGLKRLSTLVLEFRGCQAAEADVLGLMEAAHKAGCATVLRCKGGIAKRRVGQSGSQFGSTHS